MPDWRTIVEKRLEGLRVVGARRDEILRELAAHLEDEFADRRQGMPDEEAQLQALKLLGRSDFLTAQIEKAAEEDEMTQNTRAMWLPGVVMLAVFSLLLVGLGMAIVQGSAIVPVKRSGGLEGYGLLIFVTPRVLMFSALVTLLALGAVGAAWARANGATRMQRVLVSVFPVFMPMAGLLVIGPISALWAGLAVFPPAGIGELLNFVVKGIAIPAACLLLGALPFLRNGASRERSA